MCVNLNDIIKALYVCCLECIIFLLFCHTTILKEQLSNAKKEIAELQEKLRINEAFLQEMTKLWEQKLAETERIHKVGGRGQEG